MTDRVKDAAVQPIKSVILLSGGLDSTTLCALAASEGREIHALSINYGQRHTCELEAAKKAALRFGASEHIVLPINLSQFGGSSLTDASIPVEHTVPLDQIGNEIPTSYVPARNTVFLSLALAFAETRNASELWIGVNEVDYSGYPDCRVEFIHAFETLANLATKAGAEAAKENRLAFRIVAPLSELSKAEIIRLGTRLGVDYSQTITCYSPDSEGRACGTCESCRLRRAGFEEAGIPDPTIYTTERDQ